MRICINTDSGSPFHTTSKVTLKLNTAWWFKDDKHYKCVMPDWLELVSWSPTQHDRITAHISSGFVVAQQPLFPLTLTAVLFLATWWHTVGEPWATDFTSAWQYTSHVWFSNLGQFHTSHEHCHTTQMLLSSMPLLKFCLSFSFDWQKKTRKI